MNHIVIFHYHFLPGGVTDVVVSSVISWLRYSNEIRSVTIVSGRPDNLGNVREKIMKGISEEDSKRLDFEILPSIDYIEMCGTEPTAPALRDALTSRYAGQNRIWWIHNFHLGKNPRFTEALLSISRTTSQKMVFQIHDFPECSRYALLARLKDSIRGDLYSFSENVRYALINGRDLKYLESAGIPEPMLFLLENPIAIDNETDRTDSDVVGKLGDHFKNSFPGWRNGEGYMLYPVRAIRRKNIGEAALLALLADKNLIVTLPGVSSREAEYSNRCASIFREGLAPGLFGIGREMGNYGISFKDLIRSSSLILSTSVQEGFGYLFLNSLNWGKALIARDLEILESFKPVFSRETSFFYRTLTVPAQSVPVEDLFEKYRGKIISLHGLLPDSCRTRLIDSFREMTESDEIDFSYLPLSMQRKVLENIRTDDEFRRVCAGTNKSIVNLVEKFYFADCSHRKEILEKKWSYKTYSGNTDEILHSFSADIPHIKPETNAGPIYESMVDYFASPAYLRLIYDD